MNALKGLVRVRMPFSLSIVQNITRFVCYNANCANYLNWLNVTMCILTLAVGLCVCKKERRSQMYRTALCIHTLQGMFALQCLS